VIEIKQEHRDRITTDMERAAGMEFGEACGFLAFYGIAVHEMADEYDDRRAAAGALLDFADAEYDRAVGE
jgi:hypothetical protein